MAGVTQRVLEIENLFLRCRNDWRELFYALESGEESLLSEDPWRDLDTFLAKVSEQDLEKFHATIADMIESEDPIDQTQALSILSSTRVDHDLTWAIEHEREIAATLEAHLSLLLAVGLRTVEQGRDMTLRALKDPARRHAALIAFAQLDPRGAAEEGRKQFEIDRDRILNILNRPLDENEYATFYEMSKGVLQVRGKEGLNEFLRAVSGEGDEMDHDLALLVRRLIRQDQWESA
jgi:hypothetical protein